MYFICIKESIKACSYVMTERKKTITVAFIYTGHSTYFETRYKPFFSFIFKQLLQKMFDNEIRRHSKLIYSALSNFSKRCR